MGPLWQFPRVAAITLKSGRECCYELVDGGLCFPQPDWD